MDLALARFRRPAALAVLVVCALPTVPLWAQQAFSLPDAQAGKSYEYRIRTEGGLPPLNWRVSAGELPQGIELDGAAGTLHGTPTTARREAYRFELEVSDSSSPTMKSGQLFELTVHAAPLRMVLQQSTLRILPPKPEPLPETEKVDASASTPAHSPSSGPPAAPEAAPAGVGPQGQPAPAAPAGQGAAITTQAPAPGQAPDAVVSGMTAYTRAIIGLDISGASSLPSQQKFFLEFNLNAPLRLFSWKRNSTSQTDPLNRLLWVWLNPRFTALPSEAATALNGLVQGGSLSNLIAGNTNRIVQGFEFLGGLEFHLVHPRRGIPVPFGNQVGRARISPTIVLAAGAITPFSVPDKTQQEFNLTQQIVNQLNLVDPSTLMAPTLCSSTVTTNCKSVIAFVSPDRDRFFRQYYAGFRLKSYFFRPRGPRGLTGTGPCDNREGDELCDLFPGVFDAMVGQNELVSGGRLKGYVLRFEGFYPLPFFPELHVFGTAWMRVAKPKVKNPLVLDFASPALAITDPKVFVQTLTQPDRDYFRFGVGLDLVEFIRKFNKARENQLAKKDDEIEKQKKESEVNKKNLQEVLKKIPPSTP